MRLPLFIRRLRAQGQTVAQASIPSGLDVLTPLDDVVADIIAHMTPQEIVDYKQEDSEYPGIRFHFSGGMSMRNNLGLWYNETPIARWFKENGIHHGDDRSACIYKALYARLKGIPFDIAAEARYYKEWWFKTYGTDYAGNKIDSIPK
jgi:hypothetical protein